MFAMPNDRMRLIRFSSFKSRDKIFSETQGLVHAMYKGEFLIPMLVRNISCDW